MNSDFGVTSIEKKLTEYGEEYGMINNLIVRLFSLKINLRAVVKLVLYIRKRESGLPHRVNFVSNR